MGKPIKCIETHAKEWIKEEKFYTCEDILELFDNDDSLTSELARRCIQLDKTLKDILEVFVPCEVDSNSMNRLYQCPCCNRSWSGYPPDPNACDNPRCLMHIAKELL